jgi:hypothetical protein
VIAASRPWYTAGMDPVIRHVRDMDAADRRALEHVLGRPLAEDQQVIVQVVSPTAPPAPAGDRGGAPTAGRLPGWCNVFDGLTGAELADVETVIRQRADLTRPAE